LWLSLERRHLLTSTIAASYKLESCTKQFTAVEYPWKRSCVDILYTNMAVEVSPKSSDSHFSISQFVTRFRSKTRRNSKSPRLESKDENIPHDPRPPLIPSPLPLVLPAHQQALPNLGWTSITFPSGAPSPSSTDAPSPGPHPLQLAYEELFAAAQEFFNQPAAEKQIWAHKLGTEEGWSSVPGEKEFITLRTLSYCPEVLRAPAKRYWDLMGAHLHSTLARISTALALPHPEDPESALRRFVGPCATMPHEDAGKTATMLRLFRYEGAEPKVVAEPHADLGLLSVVVGNVPGLEVWDGQGWFEVEREAVARGEKGASLLVGRQLQRLSNGRFPPGGHRVVAYGRPPGTAQAQAPGLSGEDEPSEKHYRFSIVFVLRAHEPVLINSADLETKITGQWDEPVVGVTAGKLYEEICKRHFNINIGVEEREKQRRKVREGKGSGRSG
jgi:hypothetical protein